MPEILWMAVGLGAIYGLGSILALTAVAMGKYRGWRLIITSVLWAPLMIMLGVMLLLQRGRGIGPVPFQAGPVRGKLWLGPTLKHKGIAFVVLNTKNTEEIES